MQSQDKETKNNTVEEQEGLKEATNEQDCSFIAEGDLVVKEIPELKVLEQLKNDTGAIDIGKTIKDLFTSMQNMEAQLNSVFAINRALEKDLEASKEVIARLKAENQQLQQRLDAINEELPTRRELKAEIDRLIEERSEAQASLRNMKAYVEKHQAETKALNDRIKELEEEKVDLQRDIHYLELKLNSAIDRLNKYAKEIATLRGEKVSLLEKYERQNQQLKQCLEDKRKLQNYNLSI